MTFTFGGTSTIKAGNHLGSQIVSMSSILWEQALIEEKVRPYVQGDGGDCQFVRYDKDKKIVSYSQTGETYLDIAYQILELES